MAADVVMPQMGESIFEGTITKWLKKPGDKIERDEPLFEISTDKVDAEIPSPSAGVLKERPLLHQLLCQFQQEPKLPRRRLRRPLPRQRRSRRLFRLRQHSLQLWLPRQAPQKKERACIHRRSCAAWRKNMAST